MLMKPGSLKERESIMKKIIKIINVILQGVNMTPTGMIPMV